MGLRWPKEPQFDLRARMEANNNMLSFATAAARVGIGFMMAILTLKMQARDLIDAAAAEPV